MAGYERFDHNWYPFSSLNWYYLSCYFYRNSQLAKRFLIVNSVVACSCCTWEIGCRGPRTLRPWQFHTSSHSTRIIVHATKGTPKRQKPRHERHHFCNPCVSIWMWCVSAALSVLLILFLSSRHHLLFPWRKEFEGFTWKPQSGTISKVPIPPDRWNFKLLDFNSMSLFACVNVAEGIRNSLQWNGILYPKDQVALNNWLLAFRIELN